MRVRSNEALSRSTYKRNVQRRVSFDGSLAVFSRRIGAKVARLIVFEMVVSVGRTKESGKSARSCLHRVLRM